MRIRNSLSTKIIILILIVILPLITLLIFDNYYGMSLIRDQVAQSNNNLLEVYMSQLDNRLDNTTNYLKSLSKEDLDIITYSQADDNTDEKRDAAARIVNRLTNQINYNHNVELFFLYSVEDQNLLLASNDNENYEEELLKSKIEGIIFVLETLGSTDWQLMNYYGEYKLIKMIDTGMGTYLGGWLSLEGLIEPLSKLDLGDNGGVHIITENGFPLISTFSEPENPGIFNRRNINIDNGNYRTVRNVESNERFLMVADSLENVPINFIAMFPEKEIFKNLLLFRRMIYFIPVAGFVILAIYLILIRHVLFAPVHKLMSAMTRVARGDLDVKMEENSSYEFNFLFSSFNNMIERVKTLKLGIYEEKLLLQKAELKHLQSQIKPHFILNSLNIVYNLAVLKDFKSIKEMTLYLGSYLRFTLKNEDQLVTLEEELNHIKNYLEIQKIRFMDRFDFFIHSDEEYDSLLVPPLTIQPFVENSIIHGYNRKVNVYKIEIIVEVLNDVLVIRILDNGKGFSPGKILELESKNFDRGNGEHIGIWNVYRRLTISYGEDVEMKFSNRDSGGAEVKIIIPDIRRIKGGQKDV
ncbi:MAG: sensor histidine kinase [Halanaerobiales bacterium]